MSTLSILKFRATACAAAILAVVSLAPALHAQDQTAFGRVNVPFAFETGLHHFKPGTYTISMEAPTIVRIEGATDSGFVMIQLGGDRQPVTKSKVTELRGRVPSPGSSGVRPAKAPARCR